MTLTRLLLALVVTSSIGLQAAEKEKRDPIIYVEYISGHAGHPSSFEGILSIEGGAVQLSKDSRKHPLVFAIPLTAITEAKATIEQDNGSFGGQWSQGYVTITVETRDRGEAILLKVTRKHAADVAAKINFARRQVTTGAPSPQ